MLPSVQGLVEPLEWVSSEFLLADAGNVGRVEFKLGERLRDRGGGGHRPGIGRRSGRTVPKVAAVVEARSTPASHSAVGGFAEVSQCCYDRTASMVTEPRAQEAPPRWRTAARTVAGSRHSSRRNAPLKCIVPFAVLLAGCGRLDELRYEPLTTPQQWCERRPCIAVGHTVLNEPLGSFLVFLLAFLWIGVGGHFLRTRRGQRSRTWLGVALVLGGIGAAQAGISYQAFSYALKCAGREYCQLTNGFEVGYSLTQAVSVSAMLIAAAYACTIDRLRRALIGYAVINAAVYLLVSIAGVMMPNRMLLSFEVLMLFALPGIVLVIIIAGRGERASRRAGDRSLLVAAVLLMLVQVAYFAYSAAAITPQLWRDGQGFYFSENDVLHIGMIAWLAYVFAVVGKHLGDYETRSSVVAPQSRERLEQLGQQGIGRPSKRSRPKYSQE